MVCECRRGLGEGFAQTPFLGLAVLDFQRGNGVREGEWVRRDLSDVPYTPGTDKQNLWLLMPDLKPLWCETFTNPRSLCLPITPSVK